MENLEIIIYIVVALLLIMIVHLFVIEKYHKQKDEQKAIIKRDILGAPVHMIFTVGDSLVFIGIFNYFKNLPKDYYPVLFLSGIAVVVIGIVLYRLLTKWFEKHPVDRKRFF